MYFTQKKTKKDFYASNVNRKTLHKHLEFTALEQYKLLRTNLDFTLSQGEGCPVVGVTSSMRGEGKSTTAINLAYVIAEKGKRVLLIDGDLRIPSIAKKMGIYAKPGLTDLLMGQGAQIKDFQSNIVGNLYIIPSGEIPPNPSELLGSHRMGTILEELKENFDYIIIDLPPVNVVSDALSIAEFISGMVLVVRENYTEKKELERCFRQMDISNIKVLGCVMNESRDKSGSYGKYKKYKTYQSSAATKNV